MYQRLKSQSLSEGRVFDPHKPQNLFGTRPTPLPRKLPLGKPDVRFFNNKIREIDKIYNYERKGFFVCLCKMLIYLGM